MYPVKVALKAVIANHAFEFNIGLALVALFGELLNRLLVRLSSQEGLGDSGLVLVGCFCIPLFSNIRTNLRQINLSHHHRHVIEPYWLLIEHGLAFVSPPAKKVTP
jgi:hypothetical protein